ncbi:MAG: BTAD domain-containing putative transcriptional regulator, partial [Thermodesulfobacteriota bacterium]
EVIDQLHRTTDGWVAGLVLILESMKRGVEPQTIQKMAPQEIIDYFGNEFFNKTEKTIQDFLLKTALLPKITVNTAKQLTGLSNADSILSALCRDNYFTERHYSSEPVYQYHPLYREFLLTRSEEAFVPEELSSLKNQAARLLEKEGQIEVAISIYQDLENWESMAQLIRQQATSLQRQGRFGTLMAWLESLPQGFLEKDPWLLYWLGICRSQFDPFQSLPYYEKAFEGFKSRRDAVGIYLSLASLVNSIIFKYDNWSLLNHWIAELEKNMPHLKVFPSPRIELFYKTTLLSALFWGGISKPYLEEMAEKIFSLAEDTSDLNLKMQTLYTLLKFRLHAGDFEKADLIFKILQKLAQTRELSPFLKILAKDNETFYYRFLGKDEECLKAVAKGLELSLSTGIHRRDTIFFSNGIGSSLSLNDLGRAEKLLEEMASSLSETRGDVCNYHLWKSQVAQFKGNRDQALVDADQAQKLAFEIGFPYSKGVTHLRKAQVLRSLGNHLEGGKEITRALSISRKIGAKNLEFSSLLVEALLAFDQGDEPSGLLSLHEALTLGREKGYFSTNLYQPTANVRLCIKALEALIEVGYVQELIRRMNLRPEEAPLHLEHWPWPIKIFTLGRFELLIDNHPLPYSRKVQQKPLALLKALIALGGKEVREELIADILWPEADGDTSHMSFISTLHRLRSVLGQDKAFSFREGRLTLDETICWLDIRAFDKTLTQADKKWETKQTEEAVQLYQTAVALYKGPFLTGDPETVWAISLQERLKGKFLRAVNRMAYFYSNSGLWENARDCYQKALEIDDNIEDFYQNLMVCHQNLGQKSEGIAVYQRCRKTLSASLGIEPSAKTQALYNSLLTR